VIRLIFMDIFGIGSYLGIGEVANKFIADNVVGSDWKNCDAPDIHQFIISLKVGDIIFIKSCSARSKSIYVKAIGFIKDEEILTVTQIPYFEIGRNVLWKYTGKALPIPIPKHGKNNVRANTIYQEFHPDVQAEILKNLH